MTTKMEVVNATDKPATFYITLGATPGCVQDVLQLTGVVITASYPLQGHFELAGGQRIELSAPAGMGFNGNISINTPPLNCPTKDFQEGVNLAEFIINNGFQQGGQETVDISCVCGANAFLGMELSASDWTTNGGAISVNRIANGPWNNNTGRNGVFPYGCDNCTASVAPPECVGLHPEYANSAPICNVQRPAGDNQGGTVTVVFCGMTPVPL